MDKMTGLYLTVEDDNLKNPKKKLLIGLALLTVTLGASAALARKLAGQTAQASKITFRVSPQAKPDYFEGQLNAGKLVGMVAVQTDGSRLALKHQSKPACATSCPSGQKLSCWEDEEQLMSICVCVSGGGGYGGGGGMGKVSYSDFH
jgi:hypothetical protein